MTGKKAYRCWPETRAAGERNCQPRLPSHPRGAYRLLRPRRLPVILHVTQPQLHYVVAVGTVENDIVLADPSGPIRTAVDALTGEKGFSGNILVPLPHEELMQIAAAKQAEVLSQYADRRTQLDALRRRL